MKRLCFAAAAVWLAGSSMIGAAQAREPTARAGQRSPSKNIVENVAALQDETILEKAFKAAGLNDTLTGPGPFTLLAPTDQAFMNLPKGTVDNLLKPENKAQLQTVLT